MVSVARNANETRRERLSRKLCGTLLPEEIELTARNLGGYPATDRSQSDWQREFTSMQVMELSSLLFVIEPMRQVLESHAAMGMYR